MRVRVVVLESGRASLDDGRAPESKGREGDSGRGQSQDGDGDGELHFVVED